MDKRELKIDYFVCRIQCLQAMRLSEKALAAAGKAYCIYSDFAARSGCFAGKRLRSF